MCQRLCAGCMSVCVGYECVCVLGGGGCVCVCLVLLHLNATHFVATVVVVVGQVHLGQRNQKSKVNTARRDLSSK